MATNEHFSRTLSLLRQEKGISQRTAAKELEISQALLSHYENGIREPGLLFVTRACDFYNVTADFLLGRTLTRDGTTIVDVNSLYDASTDRDNVLQGSVVATLSKKLLINSLSVLFDLLGKMGNKKAIRAAADYLGSAVYTLFRHLYSANSDNCPDFFPISTHQFRGGLHRVDMIYAEVDFLDTLVADAKEHPAPLINNKALSENYPGTYQSMLQIIHNTGTRMHRQIQVHNEARDS